MGVGMTHETDPDAQLLQRFASGDTEALGELAQRHERSMLGLARGLVGGDSALARDAVQGTWVRVIRYAGTFKGRSSVKTWLYRVLVNECRRLARSRRSGPEALRLTTTERNEPDDPALHRALSRLSDEKREAVLICYHAGVTHAVAAEVLEIPLGTLKSRLHAALTELRAALAEPEREVVA